MKKLSIAVIILCVACVLSAIFMPIGFMYSFFLAIYNRDLEYFTRIVDRINVSIDQLGNVVCGDLFNKIMIKVGRQFGLEDDTISEVLARNQNNLRKLGAILSAILEKLDKGHLQKSLEENIW